tara:strand:+ start:364 stop:699 length:336 start_codon:yes stop_codon:yes gene_type:complete
MPLLNISTNTKIKNEQILLAKSTDFISSLTGKPTNFIMVKLIHSLSMNFAGNDEPCAYIEIKSIGSLVPSKMAKQVCEFFSNELKIPTERIYIFFHDVDSKQWAWNCKTFG